MIIIMRAVFNFFLNLTYLLMDLDDDYSIPLTFPPYRGKKEVCSIRISHFDLYTPPTHCAYLIESTGWVIIIRFLPWHQKNARVERERRERREKNRPVMKRLERLLLLCTPIHTCINIHKHTYIQKHRHTTHRGFLIEADVG